MSDTPFMTEDGRRETEDGRFPRRRALVALLIVLAALTIVIVRPWREMRDIEVPWTAGARAAAAEPLYRGEDGHYQFKYLPAFAVFAIPLALLPLQAAKVVWFAISVAVLVLLLARSVRLLPEQRKRTALLVGAPIVVLGKFYGHDLNLGQQNLPLALVVTYALLAIKRGREALAGSLVALAIVIKPYGILLVPWLVARRRLASTLVACAGLIAALILPALLYGTAGDLALHLDWWKTVAESTAPNLLGADSVSVAAMYAKWLGPGREATSLAVMTAGALLVMAGLMFRVRRGVAFPEGLEGATLLMLMPLLSPQGWDYVLLVATPAIVYLVNYRDRLPALTRWIATVAALVMGLSLFDVMGRAAYRAFMQASGITVCALVLFGALYVLRRRGIA